MVLEIKITPEMKRQFQSEVGEHLDNLEKMLMVLEKEPRNQEAVHSVFRAVHSIKGNSDYIGIKDVNTLSHQLEDMMDGVRSDRLTMTDDLLSVLFKGLDLLREMNRRIIDEDYEESDLSAILNRIKDIKGSAVEETAPVPKERTELDVAAVFARSSSQHVEYIRKVAGGILAGESVKGAKKNVLRVLKTFRTAANYVGASNVVSLLRGMEGELEQAGSIRKKMAGYLMDRLLGIEDLIDGMKTGSAVEKAGQIDEDFSSDILEGEMKVAPEKIDEFMNLVSELTIAKNRLNYLTEKTRSGHPGPEWTAELKRVAVNIDKLSDNLQAGVMKLRLVRINSLFERLPRIVRGLSRKSKKRAELVLLGGETEIDRKVIELLVDPLIHLIRNAVDHGIESPAVRAKKGKPESGSITVKAHEEGNNVIIEVIDDGKGLHVETIKKTALKKGLVTGDAVESMADEEILNLIFVAGFSTTQKATAVSGRGVGLDIVRNNMKDAGGNTTLESEPGVATKVKLQVPISMAVMDVLLTETAGEQYAFPFTAILETIKVKRGEIRIMNRKEVVPYHGMVLGLKHLKEILGVIEGEKLRAKGSEEELQAIVIGFGSRLQGIVVDRILRRDG
ncbi:MAG: chemotaxis protein CheA, partial [Deltaproteobacteria bacterium]|nr:chemotaxis protein CheA [Deltaproteobacteria bacterium]